jgi:hypothetical protein
MTGLDRADTDAIALLEIYPSPTSRPATSTPPAQRTPCARHQRCRLLRWSTVGAADTLPDGQNAGVAGRVKGCATGGRTCSPTSVDSWRRPEPVRSGKPVNVDAAAGSRSRPPWVQSMTWAWRHSRCELASSGVATAVCRCRRRNQLTLCNIGQPTQFVNEVLSTRLSAAANAQRDLQDSTGRALPKVYGVGSRQRRQRWAPL